MAIRSQAARTAEAGHSLPFNLMAIAVALLALGVGAAYLIDGARRAAVENQVSEDTRLLSRTLAGRELRIPAPLFRTPQDLAEGFVERVEIRLPFGADAQSVDVTLLHRTKVRLSAQLLDGVYLHQFASEQIDGPSGLIGKPLRDGNGYSGETVWYDPLSGDPFVAKCLAPVDTAQDARCLRTVALGASIAGVYSFDASLLEHWRRFDGVMADQLRKIGAM